VVEKIFENAAKSKGPTNLNVCYIVFTGMAVICKYSGTPASDV